MALISSVVSGIAVIKRVPTMPRLSLIEGLVLVGDFDHEIGAMFGDEQMDQTVEVLVDLALKHLVNDGMLVGVEQLRRGEELNQRVVGLEDIGQILEVHLYGVGRLVLFCVSSNRPCA